MEHLRAAVAGCGNISKRHLGAVCENENIIITSVCDIIPERVDSAAAQYGAKAFYSLDEMLSDGNFDVLHICLPHYLHAETALKAMELGKHVFCEKPLAIHYDDAEKMCECAKRNNVYLGTCFQNRYNQQSIYVKNLIDSGELGMVKALKGFVTWERDEAYYNADNWHGTLDKEGGGVVINQAIHTLDLMQWFISSEITDVYGSVSQKKLFGKVETEDTADALIKFENGVTALFYGTLCFCGNSPVFIEILCEKGRIVMYDDVTVYNDGEDKQILNFGKALGTKSYWGLGHKLIINDFYDSIINKKPFALSGDEGKKAVKIVDMLYKSGR